MTEAAPTSAPPPAPGILPVGPSRPTTGPELWAELLGIATLTTPTPDQLRQVEGLTVALDDQLARTVGVVVVTSAQGGYSTVRRVSPALADALERLVATAEGLDETALATELLALPGLIAPGNAVAFGRYAPAVVEVGYLGLRRSVRWAAAEDHLLVLACMGLLRRIATSARLGHPPALASAVRLGSQYFTRAFGRARAIAATEAEARDAAWLDDSHRGRSSVTPPPNVA